MQSDCSNLALVRTGKDIGEDLKNVLHFIKLSLPGITSSFVFLGDKVACLMPSITRSADRASVVTFDFVFPAPLTSRGDSLTALAVVGSTLGAVVAVDSVLGDGGKRRHNMGPGTIAIDVFAQRQVVQVIEWDTNPISELAARNTVGVV
jgi:hypothetical protein